MRKRIWALLAAAGLIVAALAAGGCGSDGDDSTADQTAASISKAAFVKQGDAICEAGRQKISAAAQGVLSAKPSAREEREIELVSTVLAPVLKTDIEELRALGVPPGDEEQVDEILAGFEELLERAEAEPEAFLAAGVSSADPWRQADKKAEEYGFTECPRS